MRKLLAILILFSGWAVALEAQTQITVSGKILNVEPNKEGKRNLPFTDELVEVFSYASKADADASMQLMDKMAKTGQAYHGLKEIDMAEADPYTGYYELKTYSDGWILVRVGLSSELRPVENRLQIDFNIRGVVALGHVVVKAANNTPNELQVIPVATARFGNVLPLNLTLPVGAHYGKSNARFVYQPYVVDCTTDSIESYGRPYLLEGKEYHATQNRRMGYDISRDTLQIYVDTLQSLSAKPFTIHYSDTIFLNHKERNYAVYGKFLFMDYNNVYYEKTSMVNTCRNILLMDFLEIPHFDPFYLDFEDYKKVAERRERPVPGAIQVNFMINRAEPDMTDSITVKQLNSLVALLNEVSSGAVLKSLAIEGIASPDGAYESNLSLAQRRTDYLQDFIARQLSVRGYERKSNARVASWAELADTIQVYDTLLAKKLLQVIEPERGHTWNSQKVKKSGLIEELAPYLQKMRKVNYTCVYVVNRPLTPAEISAKYRANPNDNFLPYEYWHLYQMIKDSNELERLYRDGARISKTYENGRAWVLPECLLAASYIRRDTVDLDILNGLIDRKPISVADKRPKLNYISRDFNGYETIVNPEAVVANQLILCLKARDFETASVMAQILQASSNPKYRLLIAYTHCMRGAFYQNKEVFRLVSSLSPVNRVVLNLMMNTNRNNAYAQKALEEMSDDTALYWYFKAVLAERMESDEILSFDLPESIKCLVKCFQIDSHFMETALRDGSLREATVNEAIDEFKLQQQEF